MLNVWPVDYYSTALSSVTPYQLVKKPKKKKTPHCFLIESLFYNGYTLHYYSVPD